jgi:hypothetical protein
MVAKLGLTGTAGDGLLLAKLMVTLAHRAEDHLELFKADLCARLGGLPVMAQSMKALHSNMTAGAGIAVGGSSGHSPGASGRPGLLTPGRALAVGTVDEGSPGGGSGPTQDGDAESQLDGTKFGTDGHYYRMMLASLLILGPKGHSKVVEDFAGNISYHLWLKDELDGLKRTTSEAASYFSRGCSTSKSAVRKLWGHLFPQVEQEVEGGAASVWPYSKFGFDSEAAVEAILQDGKIPAIAGVSTSASDSTLCDLQPLGRTRAHLLMSASGVASTRKACGLDGSDASAVVVVNAGFRLLRAFGPEWALNDTHLDGAVLAPGSKVLHAALRCTVIAPSRLLTVCVCLPPCAVP